MREKERIKTLVDLRNVTASEKIIDHFKEIGVVVVMVAAENQNFRSGHCSCGERACK